MKCSWSVGRQAADQVTGALQAGSSRCRAPQHVCVGKQASRSCCCGVFRDRRMHVAGRGTLCVSCQPLTWHLEQQSKRSKRSTSAALVAAGRAHPPVRCEDRAQQAPKPVYMYRLASGCVCVCVDSYVWPGDAARSGAAVDMGESNQHPRGELVHHLAQGSGWLGSCVVLHCFGGVGIFGRGWHAVGR